MSRTVIVTGGARGIGRHVADLFAAGGDAVIALDVCLPDAASPSVTSVQVDVTDSKEISVAIAGAGEIDVLVCNAGIQRHGLVGQQALADWHEVLSVNLTGAYEAAAAAVPQMGDGGSIVFISSVAALLGLPGRSAYAASKAGLLGLMRVLAVELAALGIRVNAICPGFTRTAMIETHVASGSLALGPMLERVPLGRLADPDEVARAVRFLAGQDASFITGQWLAVDGGWSIQGLKDSPRS